MKKIILKSVGLFFAMVMLSVHIGYSQEDWKTDARGSRAINTAALFLTIAPDARGGGMADVGVSSSADVTSLYWNPAKYAFIENTFGFQLSYVPWLTALVDDIGLMSLYGYWKINDQNAIAASLRYFTIGEVKFYNIEGDPMGDFNPNEFAIDATYSRKFSEKISGAVAARFVYSNLTQGQSSGGADTKAGSSVAADVAFYYREPIDVAYGSTLSVGVNIANIGTKMSYSHSAADMRNFIPTTLRFGPSYEIEIDRYNSIAAYIDISKLLVPTTPIYSDTTLSGDRERYIIKGKDPQVSVFQGMIQSFYDAPGGFKEEMAEFMFGLGAEYWYNKQFGIRLGYFNENRYKGNRKYLGIGASVKFNIFDLGVSYIIPTNSQMSPQDNTLRFSLSFNFQ
ncbi:MAG: type IX secretion system outer membrane channel protein PorV [Bacteroidales bacterium]|jgi:hypothetical protein|nr:type IX secretion system outer membrane channel protein PorV [Bacteroidales bacterium]